MNGTSWVLKGVDPETRDHAVREAERLGVTLADYLTDTVLKTALNQQVGAIADESEPASQAEPSDFGVRHRFRTLERRLESSVSSLDGALAALDTALFDITARVGEVEGLAGDTAQALQQSLQDMAQQVAALRLHITDVEDHAAARDDEAATAHAGLAQTVNGLAYRADDLGRRIGTVETVASRADNNAAVLANAHEALKHAVAEDFSTFSQDVNDRVTAGLREVAAAADQTAEQADAAVAHLIVELKSVRESLEQSVADGVNETRRRMHAAFSETTERMEALANRVDRLEVANLRTAEQLRTQIVDLEDATQTSIEETAESLRQAGDALAAELHRSVQDGRTALESVHSDLSGELADLRERQQGALARLRQLDSAAAAAAGDISALRELMLRRVAESEDAGIERLAALAARLDAHERDNAETHFNLRADTERVEACTLASLQKLAGDIANVEAALASQSADLREQQASAAARLTVIDMALGAQSALANRVGRLEAEASADEYDAKIGAVETRLEALAQAFAERTDAELIQRLGQLESAAPTALEERLGRLEASQAETLEALRADIVRFVNDNDRRLAALEEQEIDYNLATEFDALRRRVEDRILGVEQRSVRTLEQVADTVAMLEQRFMGRQEDGRAAG